MKNTQLEVCSGAANAIIEIVSTKIKAIKAKAIEKKLNHNKGLVQKLANFIYDKFFSSQNPNIDIKDYSAFKFYQVADKELLNIHLQKLTEDRDHILNRVDYYINNHYFQLAGICKKINKDSPMSILPLVCVSHIASFLEPDSLYQINCAGESTCICF